MRKLGVDPALPENRQNAEKIMDYRVETLLGIAQTAIGALVSPLRDSKLKEKTEDGDGYDRLDRDAIIFPPRDLNAIQKIVLDADIAQAIHALWADPVIPDLMDHSSDFYLMDSAP